MTITDRLFNRLVLGAVVIGFLSLLAAGGLIAWSIQRNQDYNLAVDHTYQVRTAVYQYRVLAERAEAARRGYLLKPDDRYRQVFAETADALPRAFDQLVDLTRDNPRQQERLDDLRPLAAMQSALMRQSAGLVQRGRQIAAVGVFRNDNNLETMQSMRTILSQISAEEDQLLKDRTARQERGVAFLKWSLGLTMLLLLAVAGGSVFVIFQYTRDLNRSRRDLFKLNASLESAVEDRTVDLRRANDEIQRFAYIVSHDLRSPLVNIMGFTSELEAATKPLEELVTRIEAETPDLLTDEARDAVRTDLPEAAGFIRASTQKMDRLINAILRLSRDGRRVLAPEPLNMHGLVAGIAASLRHRTDEIGATLTIEPLPDLVSDRVAMEQILSNLIENATKYLKPGRPGEITVRGRMDGIRALYEVQDNGRGIDPKDHDRIFDLFRRSGVQDQPGEGIGLAHVRALAYRLGGVISCESELDQGATFRLSLPAVLLPERAAE
ncbi:MAG: CHASE3 domain-containing protein [Caulobacter sp.]|nr:CHASE3 domain-containing protein [Caulobacter sp.]